MYYPSLEEIKTLSKQGNIIPIYREISADMETPVSAYLKVANRPYSFLFESVEGGERLARYSFIGTEPFDIIKTGINQPGDEIDPLVAIEQQLNKYKLVNISGLPRFHGGAVGYIAYDAVRYYEPIPPPQRDTLGLPEAIFLLVDTLLVFDHLRHTIKVVSHVHIGEGNIEDSYKSATERIDRLVERLDKPVPKTAHAILNSRDTNKKEISSNFTQDEYHSMVKRIKEYIFAGDIIQAVPSQRLSRPTIASPFNIYRTLRTLNPSPYMYYLDLDDFHIVGASPELLVRVEDGVVYNFPLAGTRKRGNTPEEDMALEHELKNNEKERAEHIMLVDLGRNDVGRVAKPGSVEVTDLMRIVKYSHVMHLESEIRGELRQDRTIYDALRSCLPAGTLSGAPKVRAMQIISEEEGERRGPYGGAVGYFGFSGNMDTAITIRTMVIKDNIAYIQAGGGIVADSDPEMEYQETLQKAQALLRSLDEAEAI
jgi:anthranilate synthase component 1